MTDAGKTTCAITALVGKKEQIHPDDDIEDMGINFEPRKDDIFVATYPKTGTTLLCFICYLIKTRGKIDLKLYYDSYQQCPWPFCASPMGIDLDAAQPSGKP
eukprot:UN07442